jgi:hypothetical protein
MSAKLFQYAIIHQPKVVRDAQGNETQPPARIVVEPTWVLAKTEQWVAMKAAKAIPDDLNDKLDEVDVAVRPF